MNIKTTHLDMSLDFSTKLLQMLNDRAIDRTSQVGMLVRNDAGLVANVVVYVLVMKEKMEQVR